MPIPSASFQDLVKRALERHKATGANPTQVVGEVLAEVGITDTGVKLKLLAGVIQAVPNWRKTRRRGLIDERRGRDGTIYRAQNGFQPERDD